MRLLMTEQTHSGALVQLAQSDWAILAARLDDDAFSADIRAQIDPSSPRPKRIRVTTEQLAVLQDATTRQDVPVVPVSVREVVKGQSFTIVQGAAYAGIDALSWSSETWVIPFDASVTFDVSYAGITTSFEAMVFTGSRVRVELSPQQTAALVRGRLHYRYQLFQHRNGVDEPILTGSLSVTA